MKEIEYLVVAYGEQLGYCHGAKYQILRCWERWYSKPTSCVTVATDRPKLFDGYPVNVVEISDSDIARWTSKGCLHFGVKLQALAAALLAKRARKLLLLDCDMFWVRNPIKLVNRIDRTNVLMYKDEGYVLGASNRSIQQFELGLAGVSISTGLGAYNLSRFSRMRGSACVGFCQHHDKLITVAIELFEKMSPMVKAHTVEQFALSETLRMSNISVHYANNYIQGWSTTGRKNYVTPVLADFFKLHGECDFKTHLREWSSINLKRPFSVLLKQKLSL